MSEAVQLGEVIKLRKGKKAVETHKHKVNGSKPYIQIDEVRGVTPEIFASDPKGVEIRADDLCIVWDGANAGTVGYGVEGIIGSTVARMRVVEPDKWDTRFIGRLLQSRFKKLNEQAQARGATIPHVDKSKLESITLPRISKGKQRRIAAILDKAYGIRRKRDQALALTDQFIESVFLEMFGDPVQNPKGWRVYTMDKLGEIQGGLPVSQKRESYSLRKPYLRVANVFRDKLFLNEVKEIGLTPEEFERVQLNKGDVLVVEGHGNPKEIGRASVWDGSIDGCVHQNHLIRFRPNHAIVFPDYISRVLNSHGGRRQLISAGRTTSGLNTISTRKVKEVTIPVPPIDVQKRFLSILRNQQEIIFRLEEDQREASYLFASISQRSFHGEF